jgi:hypothetical protein
VFTTDGPLPDRCSACEYYNRDEAACGIWKLRRDHRKHGQLKPPPGGAVDPSAAPPWWCPGRLVAEPYSTEDER